MWGHPLLLLFCSHFLGVVNWVFLFVGGWVWGHPLREKGDGRYSGKLIEGDRKGVTFEM